MRLRSAGAADRPRRSSPAARLRHAPDHAPRRRARSRARRTAPASADAPGRVLATTITPLMSLSSRCTMPGRRTPPMPDRLSPQWASSALTSVPSALPGAGMDDQAGRLVEHDQVRSSNRTRARAPRPAGPRAAAAGRRDGSARPVGPGLTGRAGCPPFLEVAVAQQGLQPRARQVRQPGGQEEVEPLAPASAGTSSSTVRAGTAVGAAVDDRLIRYLKAAVVAGGVVLVLGTALLAFLLVQRARERPAAAPEAAPEAAPATLPPAGRCPHRSGRDGRKSTGALGRGRRSAPLPRRRRPRDRQAPLPPLDRARDAVRRPARQRPQAPVEVLIEDLVPAATA